MLQSGLYNLLAVAVLMESFRIEFESLVLGILLAGHPSVELIFLYSK
jgi:hypothetical protein